MNASSLFLLFIVAICVGVLIVIAIKVRKSEESMSCKTDYDSSTVATKSVEEEKVEKQYPPQVTKVTMVTIYEYRPSSKKCLCALCDGENDIFATHCHICGQQLN